MLKTVVEALLPFCDSPEDQRSRSLTAWLTKARHRVRNSMSRGISFQLSDLHRVLCGLRPDGTIKGHRHDCNASLARQNRQGKYTTPSQRPAVPRAEHVAEISCMNSVRPEESAPLVLRATNLDGHAPTEDDARAVLICSVQSQIRNFLRNFEPCRSVLMGVRFRTADCVSEHRTGQLEVIYLLFCLMFSVGYEKMSFRHKTCQLFYSAMLSGHGKSK